MAKSQSQETTSKSEQFIYCGPNWIKHGLTKYQVFQGGKPFNLLEAGKECPEINGLICSVEKLDELRSLIERKGTRESNLYETAGEFISSSRKGNK